MWVMWLELWLYKGFQASCFWFGKDVRVPCRVGDRGLATSIVVGNIDPYLPRIRGGIASLYRPGV